MEMTTEDSMRGKFLCFRVYDGDYGIEISYVTEIIKIQDITPVPNTHDYVKGIINMRGTIVPVIDMRSRFGQGEIEFTDRTCIIVLSMDDIDMGLIVDEVQEVMEIEADLIQPPPSGVFTDIGSSSFIRAIGYPNNAVKQLLDINKIFEIDELAA
jgi:purine-binding chemotaxis protein CheW